MVYSTLFVLLSDKKTPRTQKQVENEISVKFIVGFFSYPCPGTLLVKLFRRFL